MAKFDLKKAILENKATFFSSLTEGQFSWMTQDTGEQIGSQDENQIPVYMFDDKGKYYYENDYDGYGVFGGKDYYDLVAEMNGYTADNAEEFGGMFNDLRGIGIKLSFDELETKNENGDILFPALVTKPNFNWKSHDFTQESKNDPNQSWYEPEKEDEDDDYRSDNDDDEDDDVMEGLNEAKMYFHVLEDGGYGDIGHQGVYNTKEEAQNKADKLADMFPASSFYVEASDSKDEPYNVTMEGKKKYYKDAEADDAEHIKALEKDMKDDKTSGKMKMSELKAKIREMVLAEANAPIKMVTTMDGKTVVSTHQYGVGFKSNEAGQKMGFKDNPTSIPNGTKMSSFKEDMNEDTFAPTSEVEPVEESDFLAELEGMLSKEDVQSTDPKIKAINDKIQNDPEFLKKTEDAMTKAKQGDSSDLAMLMVRFTPERPMYEAKKDEETDTEEVTDDVTDGEETVDVTDDFSMEEPQGPGGIDVTQNANADLTGTKKEVQDNLEAALEAARTLGDAKLTDQIGNTITFFTRAHVVEKGAVAEDLNENTPASSPVSLNKQNFDKIENSPLSKEYDEIFSILDNLISKYPEFQKKDIYDYFKLLAIDKYFNSGYLDRMWRKKDVAEDLNEVMFPMLKRILK